MLFLAACSFQNGTDIPKEQQSKEEGKLKETKQQANLEYKEQANSETNLNSKETSNLPKESKKLGKITDPVKLEKLWQGYLYDTITTIENAQNFNAAAEIDPLYVARYCWHKYLLENAAENLELMKGTRNSRLFPMKTVLEYSKRYFNLTSLDTKALGEYYNAEKNALVFNPMNVQRRPAYRERNPWSKDLESIVRNADGTITAVIKDFDSYQTRRVQAKITYTLKERDNGSLYFVSGQKEYINNHLVSMTGDYERFDKILGFEGNMREISILGENNNQLIIAHVPWNMSENGSLMLVNLGSMAVEKKHELASNIRWMDVAMKNEEIIVRLKDKAIIFDKNLNQLNEIPLPITIKDKIERGNTKDTRFGGYAISSDYRKIVYADEEGVKLLNLEDESEKLLSPTRPIEGTKLKSYHSSPRFVANYQKVISTMLGYESIMGYALYNLKDDVLQTYNNIGSADSFSSQDIRYDTGLLGLAENHIREKGTYEFVLKYLDFQTENIAEVNLGDIGDGGYLITEGSNYVGRNYAAFLSIRYADNDYAKTMYYIHRYNIEKSVVKKNVISVKAAQTYILGVLADGRIVFWYYLNPSEKGLCITSAVPNTPDQQSSLELMEATREEMIEQLTGIAVPLMDKEVIKNGQGEIFEWLKDIDRFAINCPIKKFDRNNIDVLLGHYEKVFSPEITRELIEGWFNYDEDTETYLATDTDFHPDLAAWEDLNIEVVEGKEKMSVFLLGDNVYGYERLGFDFKVVNDKLKVIRYKYEANS